MFTCASCQVCACFEEEKKNMPKNCPMNNDEEMENIHQKYFEPETNKFYVATKPKPDEPKYPRLRLAIELCKKMGYKKIGLAFCAGFMNEAKLYSNIIRKHGLEVESVCCLTGGYNIADYGVELPAGCNYDTACNPIAQAKLLEKAGTEFNIVMGLCVGHDSLFLKHSHVMSTVVICKDPVTMHNPAAALYLYDVYTKRLMDP